MDAEGRAVAGAAFVPDLAHAYPADECRVEIQTRKDGEIVALMTPLFGMLGALGVLPAHLSAWVHERLKLGDRALLEFFGLFQQRLVELFVQAHFRHRFWLRESSSPLDGRAPEAADPLQEALFDLLGLHDVASRKRCGLPPFVLLHHAGQLTRRPCSASALEHVLSDYFEAPVRLRCFEGAWVEIPEEARNSSAPPALGDGFALGDRFFDPADRFRIEFGPLGRALFQELLPGAEGATALTRLVRFALGPGQRFDYVLALRSEDVPAARLGAAEGGPALGQSLWTQSIDAERIRWAGPFEPEGVAEALEPELAA